jgi:hypothetical protein
MRKIMSGVELERKERRRIRALSLFMLLILLGSTAGFAFISYQQDTPATPKEGEVQDFGNGWQLRWQGQTFSLRASPQAVADIPVSTTHTLDNYAGAVLYVDAESDAILTELKSTLGRYSSRFQSACYGACTRDLPEVNCSANVIVWSGAEEGSVRQEENCVFIEGDIRAVDAFIYRTLGVQ